ncbi:hypothetical protein Taro_054705 [Colocasia esculenta]|uniref:Uncharacterized protein n=1 Tax=Colocasia esculenta TaxID=4460 RepID=A0A843XRD9_COLES|nr:hypothetical protein [Colocasia esculenta]
MPQDFTNKGTNPLTDPYTQPQLVFLQPEGKTTTLDTTRSSFVQKAIKSLRVSKKSLRELKKSLQLSSRYEFQRNRYEN